MGAHICLIHEITKDRERILEITFPQISQEGWTDVSAHGASYAPDEVHAGGSEYLHLTSWYIHINTYPSSFHVYKLDFKLKMLQDLS